jgi:hypothetical protein
VHIRCSFLSESLMIMHLIKVLLVQVVVVESLRRNGGMVFPRLIEGSHQAQKIPPLQKTGQKHVI